jgi:SrtB family sortase
MSEEKTKGKFNLVSVLLLLIGAVCIAVSIWGILGIISEYKTAVDKYNKLEDEFVHVNVSTESVDDTETQVESTEEDSFKWYKMVTVDMEGLQKQYQDIVGWIFFENEDISYPIMYSIDNEKYLYRSYDGTESASGSIFVEAAHSDEFTDIHTVIYGHNMYDMSMFAKLRYYKTKEGYYDDHKYFQIITGNRVLRYQIFACQEVKVDSYVFQERFTSGYELASKLLKKSMINPGLYFKDTDKIVTLSTCTDEDDHRFVVSAVLVGTYIITNDILLEK